MLNKLSKALYLFLCKYLAFSSFPSCTSSSCFSLFPSPLSYPGCPWSLALLSSLQPWSTRLAVSYSVSYTPAVILNEINFRKSTDWIHDKCIIYRSSWALPRKGQSVHSFSAYLLFHLHSTSALSPSPTSLEDISCEFLRFFLLLFLSPIFFLGNTRVSSLF